jgi:hypothetical protein
MCYVLFSPALTTFFLQHLNFNSEYVVRGNTYKAEAIQMDANPIRTALNVCKNLISKRVLQFTKIAIMAQ